MKITQPFKSNNFPCNDKTASNSPTIDERGQDSLAEFTAAVDDLLKLDVAATITKII